jgi:flagellar protein FlbD
MSGYASVPAVDSIETTRLAGKRPKARRQRMIIVHRLRGEPMFLNADLVESIEATPDTVLTLVDGRHVVVADAPEEIADRIVEYRAAILVSAAEIRTGASPVVPLHT